ncbi:MAG: hypothetical protein FJW38_08105 [Acidobacteria bacterium]|nr:hypothetical protein [Acidobacteriota bacterium]
MVSKRTGPSASLALTWNAVQAGLSAVKTTPRTELRLKKSAGRLLGAENCAGTASQLISRRPLVSPVGPGGVQRAEGVLESRDGGLNRGRIGARSAVDRLGRVTGEAGGGGQE